LTEEWKGEGPTEKYQEGSATFSWDRRTSFSNSENGSWIADNLARSGLVAVRLIEITRSESLSAAMILSSSSGAGGPIIGDPP